jgi:hypothetical protein
MDYCNFCKVFVSSGGAANVAATPTATIIISGVVAVVGVMTLVVGIAQMKIASAKVKLDLYNKRFNVYLATLECYQEIYGKDIVKYELKYDEFVKCYREAQFLFDKKDQIFEALGRIMKHSGDILVCDKKIRVSDEEAAIILNQKREEARLAFGNELMSLEKQLAKYISFKTVTGWLG